MEVNIIVPEEFHGEVVGDLKARKSSVEEITPKGRITLIRRSPLLRGCSVIHGVEIPHAGPGTYHAVLHL